MSRSWVFHHLAVLTTIVVLPGLATGCDSDSPASCADMRAELASIPVGATQAWNDINALQKNVTRALKLQSDIEARCK